MPLNYNIIPEQIQEQQIQKQILECKYSPVNKISYIKYYKSELIFNDNQIPEEAKLMSQKL